MEHYEAAFGIRQGPQRRRPLPSGADVQKQWAGKEQMQQDARVTLIAALANTERTGGGATSHRAEQGGLGRQGTPGRGHSWRKSPEAGMGEKGSSVAGAEGARWAGRQVGEKGGPNSGGPPSVEGREPKAQVCEPRRDGY